ncbi:hypothetical protein FB45DRAFT_1147661 [Roridomyces roridus]|uniref:Transmembrane protein n=1 Tax=Roridomyces roridus TaxID=1738132 RepID=A0AAD7FQM1_9AGAR|nr:hypothetical protein FB45DRAFT_1147661 [Roridomyces roridus]
MAPLRTYNRAPLQPTRLLPRLRKDTPAPTPLTREQIQYLAAKASEKQRSDVPNPIPDTGPRPSPQRSLGNPSASPSVLPTHTTAVSTTSSPLSTRHSQQSPTLQSRRQRPFQQHWRRSLARSNTVPATVAGAFVLLGLFVAIKLCVRPARRSIPVPSRPILDDPFPDDEIFPTKLEDSPVFGGKERLSERPGNSSLWTWTQYPTPATTVALSASQSSTDKAHDLVDVDASPYPMQQVHNVLTRAASRLSMASVYPSPSNNHNYGLVTAFTADGHPVMERVTPKVLQRSRSSTLGERSSRDRPTRFSYAYDGAEVTSPQMTVRSPPASFTPAMPGRTRIKSSYYAHPRISTMPSSQATKVDVRPEVPPVASPQPTLYPDDSLSVVDAKRAPRRVHKKPAPSNRASRVFGRGDDMVPSVTTPTLDPTAALGNLMLMDFGGQSAVDLTSPSSATLAPKSRSDDKPPRVPSPPPLPSLTQMGLEHSNPQEYADYRSPTYSIFGLYEADRKSRIIN